ncbi:MAG: LysM peptidoglycan-binding domain-containing protein, partial [Vibrio sp.]
SSIANKFKVKTADIVKWNGLNNQKHLQPGQQLKLYVDVTKISA